MGNNNRFLDLPYLVNTFKIKYIALQLKLRNGPCPYDFFKGNTKLVELPSYSLRYQKQYQSLSYLDYPKAQKLHAGNRSTTQDLILGLVYYNEIISGEDLPQKYLVELAKNLKVKADETNDGMTFFFDEPYDRFGLKGRYSSGIVQGKAASFFLRCYEITKDQKYKIWAKKCLLSAWISFDKKGTRRKLSNSQYWIEEYPSPKPSMVLNGFLFYIIGLAEYLTFEEDEMIKSHFELCLTSVMTWMPKYKIDGGLLYSMYRWNLCNVHYTGIMKFQFEHLFQLTNIDTFKKFAYYTNVLTNWKTFDRLITQ